MLTQVMQPCYIYVVKWYYENAKSRRQVCHDSVTTATIESSNASLQPFSEVKAFETGVISFLVIWE